VPYRQTTYILSLILGRSEYDFCCNNVMRACALACVRACVRACVCVCVGVCVCVCVCVLQQCTAA